MGVLVESEAEVKAIRENLISYCPVCDKFQKYTDMIRTFGFFRYMLVCNRCYLKRLLRLRRCLR